MSTNDRTEDATSNVQVKTKSPDPTANLEKNQHPESDTTDTKDRLKEVFAEVREKQLAEAAEQALVQEQAVESAEPLSRDELKQKRLEEKEAKKREQAQKRIQAKNPEATETTSDTEAEAPGKKQKRVRVRLFPIWLRLVIVFLLMVFLLAAGVMVGYGIIGDGEPFDALKQSTWTHIIDIVNKRE